MTEIRHARFVVDHMKKIDLGWVRVVFLI